MYGVVFIFLMKPEKENESLIRIQAWTFAYIWLLNKSHVNGMISKEQNRPLKGCQPQKLLIYFGKGIRSFHTSVIGSSGQRAAKLLAVKVGWRS